MSSIEPAFSPALREPKERLPKALLLKPIAMSALPVCLLLILAHAASASDWPTYRHDYNRVGRTEDPLPADLGLVWSFSSSEQPELAWPGPGGRVIEELHLRRRMRFDGAFHTAIAGGKVFFGSSVDHHVYAFDLTSGKSLWQFATGGPVRLAPTFADGKVYFGSDDGCAYCLDAESGQLVWKLRVGLRDEQILARGRLASRWPVRTSVLVDQGVAYLGAGTFPHENVYLIAVDADTGNVVWRNDTISQRSAGRNDLSPQGYLLATKNRLFVPSGRTLPAAVDRATGRLIYKQRGGGKQVGGTEALLTDGKVYTVGDHAILAFDQAGGNILGRLPARQITLRDNMAYIATGGEIDAVDHTRYAKAFRNEKTRNRFLQLKAELLEQTERGDGYQAKRREAESLIGVKWRAALPHEAALILAGNTLVAGGEGEVVTIDATTGQTIWKTKVDGEASGLAVSDGHLLVSTTAGTVYCFGDARATPDQVVQHGGSPTDTPYPQDVWSAIYAKAAEAIVDQSGVTRGYCLVLGSEEGRLAHELAKRTDLEIYCVEEDPQKVATSRKALMEAGLYGSRISVEQVDLAALPLPNYFANLVVSDTLLRTGRIPGNPEQIARHVKPIGGVVCLGVPEAAAVEKPEAIRKRAADWIAATGLDREDAAVRSANGWTLLTRGPLPGAADWTHPYGNVANTACVGDERVRGGLRVLWYGDPGPSAMVNRHMAAPAPVSIDGRLIVQGQTSVMAYDAYNGLFLWELENPGAIRFGLKRAREPGNLVAGDDAVFNAVGDACWEIDAASGQIVREYKIPDAGTDPLRQWGYVAYANGRLFGTSTRRQVILREGERPEWIIETDKLFAIDRRTGNRLWTYDGKSISHTAVVVADGRIIFVDSSITPEERQAMLQQDKSELAQLTGEARRVAERRLKRMDVRLAVALDVETGAQLWAKPVDVTDCSQFGIGGGKLALMYQDGHVVFCGANANGHFWDQFLAGEFKRRRLVVLRADDGELVWAKDANYRHRPIIVGDQIIAEPWAFALSTGAQVTRTHPLTGEETAWNFIRPGHHCGAVSASPNMLLLRSGFTSYYDLETDSGIRHFGGHRLGCWINAIPAGGLVLVPEASAGCACLFSLTSTVVFEPSANRQVWSVYTADGPRTPVRHLAINLGGPGDRRDATGKLWLGFPRPWSRPGLDLPLQLDPQFVEGGRFVQDDRDADRMLGTETPWVFTSGASGLRKCTIPLIDPGQSPTTYTVRLYFVANEANAASAKAVRVKLQDKVVAESLDLSAAANGSRRALEVEYRDVAVRDRLIVELIPEENGAPSADPPILAGMEVLRTGAAEIVH